MKLMTGDDIQQLVQEADIYLISITEKHKLMNASVNEQTDNGRQILDKEGLAMQVQEHTVEGYVYLCQQPLHIGQRKRVPRSAMAAVTAIGTAGAGQRAMVGELDGERGRQHTELTGQQPSHQDFLPDALHTLLNGHLHRLPRYL